MNSILNDRDVATRLQRYPDRLAEIDRAYAAAVECAKDITVHSDGSVKDEIKHFKSRLRDYQLSLETCRSYAANLELDIESDLTFLQNTSHGSTDGPIYTLSIELATARHLRANCEGNLFFARIVRRTLATIEAEQDLAKLIQLERELSLFVNP